MKLTRRDQVEEEDSAKTLIELLAEVADVLSDYQERIAEEARLQTGADRRRSLRELSRKLKVLSKEVYCLKADFSRASRLSKKSKANDK